MKEIYVYYIVNFFKVLKKYQSGFVLLFVVAAVLVANYICSYLIDRFIKPDFMSVIQDNDEIIGFAPEAWLSLLGLVLGTLIIVISVASQSTPKLIDLYTRDQTSLLYVWYIVVGSVHNMFLQLYGDFRPIAVISSMLFNTYFMLPAALLLAVPYVLYILRYTKTSNVVEKIALVNLRRIRRLGVWADLSLLKDERLIAEYQFELFESLNQLDDLLAYVSFKEPKGDIINKISQSIQAYVAVKPRIAQNAPEFFRISPHIAPDVSFKTMTVQFQEMEDNRTFYEQKGFRLLGNAYFKLIDKDEFDLASLCAYELSECGRAAIEYQDQALIQVVLIRFNTLIRFGIKHGLKNQEPRNLYNAIFHYSGFIHHIIKSGDREMIKKSCTYLNIYVNEIYQHSRKNNSFAFLVDAFTWEFKRILIELNKEGLDPELQNEILHLFLRIDNLPDPYEDSHKKGQKFSSGVRTLQIALALYYLHSLETMKKKHDLILADAIAGETRADQPKSLSDVAARVESLKWLVKRIIQDILDDHAYMERSALRRAVAQTCQRLAQAEATFGKILTGGTTIFIFLMTWCTLGLLCKCLMRPLRKRVHHLPKARVKSQLVKQ
ncbi:MAG: hypothetical protein HC880_09540 [Bacteroidia bacterium]|nr:hypothetical protein [Bacteroidia bacterium]